MGRKWTPEQKEERSQQLKDYWKSPEGQARLEQMKNAGYDGTGFKKYWETHKDKSLPDQRENRNRVYASVICRNTDNASHGYLTFRRQVRLGLIPPDSKYEDWVEEYVPHKQHNWLKK